MKTKISLLILCISLMGYTVAHAQGNSYKQYKKSEKFYKKNLYYRQRNAAIYRNRSDDYRYRGKVYHPPVYTRKLPPGQAKKIYGYQSAKVFAPGQQNKRYQYPVVYYPQRKVIYYQRYDDDYYRQRSAGEVARRIGGIFGL